MTELVYTFLTDGSSDSALMPVLDWLLRTNGVACALQGVWADLRRLPRPPAGLVARLRKAVDLYPCELLFIHRDSEREVYQTRKAEIEAAIAEAFPNTVDPMRVCVIPVRMREAWLLFDEQAIRRAAGNPSGREALHLPPLMRCQDLPDPKEILDEILRQASGLSGRRRTALHTGLMMRRIAEYTSDFAPLRSLSAFTALEMDLQGAIQARGWDHR